MLRNLLLVTLSLLVVAVALTAAPCQAGNWVFERSYYSHNPVNPVRIGPPLPPGGPYYSRIQGEHYSGGIRQLNSVIQVGPVTDRYQTWEVWGQRGVQY
jgi:hypothetical protein